MKRKVIRYSLCALLLFLVAATGFYFSPIARDVRRAEHHKRELGVAPDLREVGAACVSLLQSGWDDTLYTAPNDLRLPPALRSKNPLVVSINQSDQTVIVEFAGGFIHCGYRLEPVSMGADKWKLLLYGEEPDDEHELLSF